MGDIQQQRFVTRIIRHSQDVEIASPIFFQIFPEGDLNSESDSVSYLLFFSSSYHCKWVSAWLSTFKWTFDPTIKIRHRMKVEGFLLGLANC